MIISSMLNQFHLGSILNVSLNIPLLLIILSFTIISVLSLPLFLKSNPFKKGAEIITKVVQVTAGSTVIATGINTNFGGKLVKTGGNTPNSDSSNDSNTNKDSSSEAKGDTSKTPEGSNPSQPKK